MPSEDQKLFVQQVVQENGALDPSLTGGTDRGFSFGIGQWNKNPIRAKRWLELHPEQATLTWQIQELARNSCDSYKKFHGNVRRAIVAHNCPDCANKNAAPMGCGGVDSYHRQFKTCYFHDEVDGPENATRFSLMTL